MDMDAEDRDEQMTEEELESSGIRERGEEALNDLANAILDNPLLGGAIGTALGAGERAVQAQRQALGAMDVASAGDVERLEKRVRSLSDRVEALEDALDSLGAEIRQLRREESDSTSS